ncbi:MAG TPA: hypothetical protein VIJ77_12060, partial [Candidatus Tumulicola sp.]
ENHDEIRAAADVADVALSADARGELSDRSKLCRQCKTLDLAFDMGDRTWLCRACAEGEV